MMWMMRTTTRRRRVAIGGKKPILLSLLYGVRWMKSRHRRTISSRRRMPSTSSSAFFLFPSPTSSVQRPLGRPRGVRIGGVEFVCLLVVFSLYQHPQRSLITPHLAGRMARGRRCHAR